MWLQTAEILMILRPESEPISDFQDYTLVAVIAVATHLMGTHAGDHHFLAALAQRFSQDATALHQVWRLPPLPPPPPPSLSKPAVLQRANSSAWSSAYIESQCSKLTDLN